MGLAAYTPLMRRCSVMQYSSVSFDLPKLDTYERCLSRAKAPTPAPSAPTHHPHSTLFELGVNIHNNMKTWVS